MSVVPEFIAQPGDMVRSIYAPKDPPLLVIEAYQVKHGNEDGYSNPKWYYILLFPAIDNVIRVSQTSWKRVD